MTYRPRDPGFLAGAILYGLSALTFLTELAGEITGYYLFSASWIVHEIIALVTLLGFVVGGLLIWRSYRHVRKRHDDDKRLLRSAQGEFFEMLSLQFDAWHLSDAEREVALLTVKGMSVSEIAEIRQTTPGTVKSQNNAIYRKAGVNSRTQLLGSVIDGLLVDPSDITPPPALKISGSM